MLKQHTPLFGGTGGSPFNDTLLAPSGIVRMLTLTIRSGAYIDSVQATYRLENGQIWTAPTHGGGGGSPITLSLTDEDHISTLVLRTGAVVDQLTVITSRGGHPNHVYGPFGGSGGSPQYIIGNIVALYGRSGAYLDALGIYGDHLSWGTATTTRAEERHDETTKLHGIRAA